MATPPPPPRPHETRHVTSFDGTRIAYHVAGRGPRAWLIPPGLGTPLATWRYIAARFADTFTLYIPDPRGMYDSGRPPSRAAVTVPDHARDMRAIVEAEGLDDFVLGGWSLAVQISLEYYRHHAEGVRALVLINGAYERVLSTAFAMPGADAVLPRVVRSLLRLGPALTPLVRAVMISSGPQLMRRLGLVAGNVEGFSELYHAVRSLDWRCYLATLLAANEHSAADVLPTVRVPTLITAGDKDQLTPVSIAQRLHEAVGDSELVLIPGGTHYSPTEFPDLLNDALARFFARVYGG